MNPLRDSKSVINSGIMGKTVPPPDESQARSDAWPKMKESIEKIQMRQEEGNTNEAAFHCRLLSEHILATMFLEKHPRSADKLDRPTLGNLIDMCMKNKLLDIEQELGFVWIKRFTNDSTHYQIQDEGNEILIPECVDKTLRMAQLFLPQSYDRDIGPRNIDASEVHDVICHNCETDEHVVWNEVTGYLVCGYCQLEMDYVPTCPECEGDWEECVEGPDKDGDYCCSDCDIWFDVHGGVFVGDDDDDDDDDDDVTDQLSEAVEKMQDILEQLRADGAVSTPDLIFTTRNSAGVRISDEQLSDIKSELVSRIKKFRNSLNGVEKRGFSVTERDSIRKSALRSHCEDGGLDWGEEIIRRRDAVEDGIDEWTVWSDVDSIIEISMKSRPSNDDWCPLIDYLKKPSIVGEQSQKENYAILIRCDPKRWSWDDAITEEGHTEISWTTRFRLGTVDPGTPVIVLGTGGTGVLGKGVTLHPVIIHLANLDLEARDRADELWAPGYENQGQGGKKILLKLSRFNVNFSAIKKSEIKYLIRRQSTMTWLTKQEYETVIDLGSE